MLLSVLMIAACGNGEKKATETTTAPTTEVTTATPTTAAPTTTAGTSSETKEVSLEDTQRIGREDVGYVNVPKEWKEFKDLNGGPQYQYSALDAYNIVTLNAFTKEQAQPGNGETWGAEMIANRLYSTYDKVYSTSFEGDKETLQKMFDLIEQTWGLDAKTPGQ